MSGKIWFITHALTILLTLAHPIIAQAQDGNVTIPRYPSISPDGQWIVFSWRGDLWKVASEGGSATRLTNHPGDELRSTWSPDGQHIAFESTRSGATNIHLMNADGTDIRQLSAVDRPCALNSFGVDENGHTVVTFHSYMEGDAYREFRPYMVSTDGGDLRRIHDAFGANPCISPDGTRVVFQRGGFYGGVVDDWERRHYDGPEAMDLWLFDRPSDSFQKLTTWKGNDGSPKWGGERTILYLSNCELNCVNLWRMSAEDGDRVAARLTDFTERDVQSFDVTADGSTVVFMVWDTLYTLDLNNPQAQPVPLTIVASEDENDNYELKSIDRTVSEATLSPDNQVMAFVSYGEVYVRNVDENSLTRRVTFNHAREKDIAWSPDGLKLYFTSDRDGTESIYAAAVSLTRSEVKEQFDEALNPPEEKPPADEVAEETKETPSEEPESEEGSGSETPAEEPAEELEEEEEDAADQKDKGKKEEEEEKETPPEYQPERWHDAMKFTITPVVLRDSNDRVASPSPDGKRLAFRGDYGNLHVMDLESGEIHNLVTHWDAWIEWEWSPDSSHIAYAQSDLNFNQDIFIIPVDNSQPPINVTRHPDNDVNPQWSADGKILTFTSERVNEQFDVWMVYLDKDLEALTSPDLKKYYEDAAKAAKKREPLKVEVPEDEPEESEETEASEDDATDAGNGEEDEEEKEPDEIDEAEEEEEEEEPLKLDLDDAYLRVRRVTSLGGNEMSHLLTPGGDRIIFNAYGDISGLHSVKWDGSDRKKLTSSCSLMHVNLGGDKVVVVSGSQGGTISPTGNKIETVSISDKIRIDLEQQACQKFNEVTRGVGEGFYSSTMNDVDWETLAEEYYQLALQTRTVNEFNHVCNRLLGELNASHLGVYMRGDSSPNTQPYGRLGAEHHRVADGFMIDHVIPQSPADRGPMKLQVGDVITAVELEPFEEGDTFESRLHGLVGKETLFTVRRTLESGETVDLDVLITPTSYGRIAQLKYREWRLNNAQRVDDLSDGQLGYIHVQRMGQGSLDVFERDLFAACEGKQGLIIDVRNNGGGWTADRLLASIMVQPHAYTVPRGADHIPGYYPQDRLFIQRYTLPINMLCNEKSFSNAEIIAHAFKTLKRGTLVGQQTYGGVISTGGWGLIDGTFVRLPFRGWYVLDGTDMELNGAIPNLIVEQHPDDEVAGVDRQLQTAVDDLLERVNSGN